MGGSHSTSCRFDSVDSFFMSESVIFADDVNHKIQENSDANAKKQQPIEIFVHINSSKGEHFYPLVLGPELTDKERKNVIANSILKKCEISKSMDYKETQVFFNSLFNFSFTNYLMKQTNDEAMGKLRQQYFDDTSSYSNLKAGTIIHALVTPSKIEQDESDGVVVQFNEEFDKNKRINEDDNDESHGNDKTNKTEYFKCEICLEARSVDIACIINDCKHKVCRSCLKSCIIHDVQYYTRLPACPICMTTVASIGNKKKRKNVKDNGNEEQVYLIDKSIIKDVLNDNQFAQYCTLLQRQKNKKDNNVQYYYSCPDKQNCGYDTVLSVELTQKELGKGCPKCKNQKLLFRKISKLDVNNLIKDREMDEMIQKQGWKRCPDCRNVISKFYGCNHIRCRCGIHFCYLCLAILAPNNPSSHFWSEQNDCVYWRDENELLLMENDSLVDEKENSKGDEIKKENKTGDKDENKENTSKKNVNYEINIQFPNENFGRTVDICYNANVDDIIFTLHHLSHLPIDKLRLVQYGKLLNLKQYYHNPDGLLAWLLTKEVTYIEDSTTESTHLRTKIVHIMDSATMKRFTLCVNRLWTVLQLKQQFATDWKHMLADPDKYAKDQQEMVHFNHNYQQKVADENEEKIDLNPNAKGNVKNESQKKQHKQEKQEKQENQDAVNTIVLCHINYHKMENIHFVFNGKYLHNNDLLVKHKIFDENSDNNPLLLIATQKGGHMLEFMSWVRDEEKQFTLDLAMNGDSNTNDKKTLQSIFQGNDVNDDIGHDVNMNIDRFDRMLKSMVPNTVSNDKKIEEHLERGHAVVDKYLQLPARDKKNKKGQQGTSEAKNQKSKMVENRFLAIYFWTTSLIYAKLNRDLRDLYRSQQNAEIDPNNNTNQNLLLTNQMKLHKWKEYLHLFHYGIKQLPYYKPETIIYRGLHGVSSLHGYQIGKHVCWPNIVATSKKRDFALKFAIARQPSVLFEIVHIDGRDISKISQFPKEEEVLLLPYSHFLVVSTYTQKYKGVNVLCIKLKQCQVPSASNIVFWIDDNVKNNVELIHYMERKFDNTCIVTCKSTFEALNLLDTYNWLMHLNNAQIRIITDSVRFEVVDPIHGIQDIDEKEKVWVYDAGIKLIKKIRQKFSFKYEILIYCGQEKKARQACINSGLTDNVFVTTNASTLVKFVQFQKLAARFGFSK